MLTSGHLEKRKLTATTGLAALSLDAMASVAYGPEAIVVVLGAAGSSALGLALPVSAAIVVLLALLIASYRQLIAAFPDGGGAYACAKKYLGRRAGLLAGASLVVDYVLNVAVSVAAGTAALTSAVPATRPYTLWIGLGVLVAITALNLRGIVSAAWAFMAPTVIFVVAMVVLIVVGLTTSGPASAPAAPENQHSVAAVGMLLLLKAFANGCAALTGVEAIANATPEFRRDRVRRAQRAEVALGVLLGAMLLGISALVARQHVTAQPGVTVLSQLAENIFGRGAAYFVIQAATVVLLALAANTSFGGLPQLMKVVAADDYLPHRLTRRTRRGVYRVGVLALAGASGVLIVVTDGDVNLLVGLFAICVFVGFTLAQAGLVRHWWKERSVGWRWRLVLNAVGGVATAVAAVVVTVMKSDEGSLWVIVVLVALVAVMSAVSRCYRRRRVDGDRAVVRAPDPAAPRRHSFAGQGMCVVAVAGPGAALDEALRRGRAFGREVRAVHVDAAGEPDSQEVNWWRRCHPTIPLDLVPAASTDVIADAFADHVGRLAIADDVLVLLPDPYRRAGARALSSGRIDDLESVLTRRGEVTVARVTDRGGVADRRSLRAAVQSASTW